MEIKALLLLLVLPCCKAQSNVRVSYSAPDGHYVEEARSVDGTSILGKFGYQSSDGRSVGVSYGSDGAGFVIGSPSGPTLEQPVGIERAQAAAAATAIVDPPQRPLPSSQAPLVVTRGRSRPPRPISDLPLFPTEPQTQFQPMSTIPAFNQARVSAIDDIITQLDQRQSTAFQRKQRRRKQRRPRVQQPI